jgi:hypothetical protein
MGSVMERLTSCNGFLEFLAPLNDKEVSEKTLIMRGLSGFGVRNKTRRNIENMGKGIG